MLPNRTRGRVCSAALLCCVLSGIPNASAGQASAPDESAGPPNSPASPEVGSGSAASATKSKDTSASNSVAPGSAAAVAQPSTSSAPAAEAPTSSEQPSASAAAAPPEAGSAQDEPVENADEVAETQAPTGSLTDARRVTELKAQLQRESARRVDNLWPWLTLSVGAGAVLVGTLYGAGYVLACDDECGTTPWVSVLVVAGAGVATLGTIWLLRINADNAQVESRTHRLERELDRLDRAAGLRNRSQARAAPIVSLHF